MKKLCFALGAALALAGCSADKTSEEPVKQDRIICAYMTHASTDSINPQYINRLIYSYVTIDSTLSNMAVKNPERLGYAVSLKKDNPELEVMVSIGTAPGAMSKAMRNDSLRALVVKGCKNLVDTYGLDGIDVDWEFPGRGDGALSEKEDVANYVKLLADLREALGEDKILTIACAGSGYGVDYTEMNKVLNQFNVMCYDMGTPPSHHSALYDSDRSEWLSVEKSMKNYTEGGVPPEKIVLGMPFYGRGADFYDDFIAWNEIAVPQWAEERFDSVAMVPWIADSLGNMILTYDTPESLAIKCEYIKANNIGGGMYWRIEQDDKDQSLGRAVAEGLR